ncbi:hypothetical protein [Actinophytocola sp. NPDC049390]|uniref:hypothetical protein n=1 Tax=Actinophytocola sp. NPDC049390 TaxID=3363894 RepID=UPI00378D81A6
MNENDHTAHEAARLATGSDLLADEHPAGPVWCFPVVTFGRSVAALAITAAPIGILALGLLSGDPDIVAGTHTTCCPTGP